MIPSRGGFNSSQEFARNRMGFFTDWRKQPSTNYRRDLIRDTIAGIFSTNIHYEQVQQPCDIATILEQSLFADAASEDEYMNKETLIHRLQTQLDKLQGTKNSQAVDSSIVNNQNGLLNRGLSHPSILHETVSLADHDLPPFPDMIDLSYYNVSGGASNSSKSTIPHFQQQHSDNDMNMRKYGGYLETNQKNEHVTLLTTMGNSPQTESLNLLIPQNASREFSDVSNLLTSMSSSWQSSSLECFWQGQPLKLGFPHDFKHLEQPYAQRGEHCFCCEMLGQTLKEQTQLPTINLYGEKQFTSESSACHDGLDGPTSLNLHKSLEVSGEQKILLEYCNCKNLNNVPGDHQSSFINHNYSPYDDFEDMLPLLKRQKMDPGFDVSLINNSISNSLAHETIQPCTLGGIAILPQRPQFPLFEVTESNMEQFTHPTLDSISISEIKSVMEEAFERTFKFNNETMLSEGIEAGHISEESHPRSHHVTANNNLKEDIRRLNSSAQTICSDDGAKTDIGDEKGKTEFKNETILSEGFEATYVLEEPHPKSRHVIACSNLKNNASTLNSSAPILHNDPSAVVEVRIALNQAAKNTTNEVDEPKVELEKETNCSNPTVNVVSLTEFLTYDQIREHVMSFGQQSGQGDKEEISVKSCELCGMDELPFKPLPIYCLSCDVRIQKNASYYCKKEEEIDADNCLCPTCYRNSIHGKIAFKGTFIAKTLFDRKINDVTNEPWVQCVICKRRQHQICALFDCTRDLEGNAGYMCPRCCLKESENGMRAPLSKTTTFGAKDLPVTMLSEHMEQRLFKRLAQEREDMAKIEGKNVDEVLTAENLCVRVVSSVVKQLKVEKLFLDILSARNYPSKFYYASKAILLFQKIEGVDVCLFVMYVQEFGSECRHPNKRCVYISYLDSVQYMVPQRVAATGEALRTFIYHEILIGYLEFSKKRGFATCYIWSCAPKKGVDYILYCHPKTQKTPKNDKLRHWYHSMLRKAMEENIVVGLTNIYDHFFDTAGRCGLKVTAARLPYFDGDYWSGAAMDLLKKIEETGGKDVSKVKKRSRKRTWEHTNPSEGTSKDFLVMQELGQGILPFKEDFIIVHLQYACIKCHEVIMSGKRWFCTECKEFQECERCHTADTHISISGEKHTLLQVLVDDIPIDTKENDIILDNKLLETRNKFLSFCQKKHFQFDTLRHAKHSSIMILRHLKNPTVMTISKTCSLCCKDNEFQKRWQCEICPFTVCSACYEDRGASCHYHRLNQCASTELCQAGNQELK